MNKYSFFKMQGLGNDFVIIRTTQEFSRTMISQICNRQYGIGCDQLVLIRNDMTMPYDISMYNSDGSDVNACGNAYRCLIKLLAQQPQMPVQLKINNNHNIVTGHVLASQQVYAEVGPIKMQGDALLPEITIDYLRQNDIELLHTPQLINVGNDHIILMGKKAITNDNMAVIGAQNPKFNVEYVWTDNNHTQMLVCEHGAGVTMACGTGAMASACAIYSSNKTMHGSPITIMMTGGQLIIHCHDFNNIAMEGPANIVFSGEFMIDNDNQLSQAA